jgi:hypothetical protein
LNNPGPQIIQPGKGDLKSFHLAGIVPIAGQPLNFKMPWDDYLMPVAANYLAVENAVYECAAAGCETIWIVAYKETQPLIRYRLGDFILDPIFLPKRRKKFVYKASEEIKEVPIYYVPIHSRDREKRDCLAWSAIYGAIRAYRVSKKISRWVVPDRYYISWPYGMYPTAQLQKKYYRKIISSRQPFFLSYDGKTIKDGEYLSCTFTANDILLFYKNIKKLGTGVWKSGGWWNHEENKMMDAKKLSPEERYSARYFTLDRVFKHASLDGATVLNLNWYFNIDNWEGYCNYLGSEKSKSIRRPNRCLKYSEFDLIGEEHEDEEHVDEDDEDFNEDTE